MQETTISICSNPLPQNHVTALANIEDGYWWFEGRAFWASKLVEAALKNSGLASQDSSYLDLGCGTGGFARSLTQYHPFKTTVLVDGDPQVLELAARYPGSQIQHLDFNTRFKLPVSAPIMTCMDVMEHLPHDEIFVKTVAEQMPSNGNLIISVPAYPSFYSKWDRQLGHFRRYTPTQLRAVLRNAGLKIQFLSPMWSFLAPAAPIRKMRASRYLETMEFEKVPAWANSVLITLSKYEWGLAKWIRMPVGTSLIAWATKR